MADHISWILVLKVHPGKEKAFKQLAEKLIESTRNEAKTLAYEWSFSDDGRLCHIYERYVDSTAIKIHIGRNGEQVGQLLALSAPLHFYVCGTPDEQVREGLADLNPVYVKSWKGFTR
jgi:quinol monooxygenase YgiN